VTNMKKARKRYSWGRKMRRDNTYVKGRKDIGAITGQVWAEIKYGFPTVRATKPASK